MSICTEIWSNRGRYLHSALTLPRRLAPLFWIQIVTAVLLVHFSAQTVVHIWMQINRETFTRWEKPSLHGARQHQSLSMRRLNDYCCENQSFQSSHLTLWFGDFCIWGYSRKIVAIPRKLMKPTTSVIGVITVEFWSGIAQTSDWAASTDITRFESWRAHHLQKTPIVI